MFTSDFKKKPTQSTTSVKPTTSFLQTRLAPLQTDENVPPPQYRYGYSENILKELINQHSTHSSDTRIQTKPRNPLKAIAKEGMTIQAKLNIGEPNDKYEKEADVIAVRVVQQINSPNNSPVNSSIQDLPIQRQESGEEQELQMKPLLQRRKNNAKREASSDLESSIQSARGSGHSLDSNLQAKMGQAMGADFSGVRVHTDAQSDRLNKSIQAKAFTTGQDVFFRQGEYNPNSKSGQELIAHELTHVVQQKGAVKVQRMLSPLKGEEGVFQDDRYNGLLFKLNTEDTEAFGCNVYEVTGEGLKNPTKVTSSNNKFITDLDDNPWFPRIIGINPIIYHGFLYNDINRIGEKYEPIGRCHECATDMQNAFMKAGIKSKVYDIGREDGVEKIMLNGKQVRNHYVNEFEGYYYDSRTKGDGEEAQEFMRKIEEENQGIKFKAKLES